MILKIYLSRTFTLYISVSVMARVLLATIRKNWFHRCCTYFDFLPFYPSF